MHSYVELLSLLGVLEYGGERRWQPCYWTIWRLGVALGIAATALGFWMATRLVKYGRKRK